MQLKFHFALDCVSVKFHKITTEPEHFSKCWSNGMNKQLTRAQAWCYAINSAGQQWICENSQRVRFQVRIYPGTSAFEAKKSIEKRTTWLWWFVEARKLDLPIMFICNWFHYWFFFSRLVDLDRNGTVREPCCDLFAIQNQGPCCL